MILQLNPTYVMYDIPDLPSTYGCALIEGGIVKVEGLGLMNYV